MDEAEHLVLGVHIHFCLIPLCSLDAENFTCLLRLKSTAEQDTLRLQPGGGETTVLLVTTLSLVHSFAQLLTIRIWLHFIAVLLLLVLSSIAEGGVVRGLCSLPEHPGDDLLLDLHDLKGNLQGRLTVHVSSISDDPVSSSNAAVFAIPLTIMFHYH